MQSRTTDSVGEGTYDLFGYAHTYVHIERSDIHMNVCFFSLSLSIYIYIYIGVHMCVYSKDSGDDGGRLDMKFYIVLVIPTACIYIHKVQ